MSRIPCPAGKGPRPGGGPARPSTGSRLPCPPKGQTGSSTVKSQQPPETVMEHTDLQKKVFQDAVEKSLAKPKKPVSTSGSTRCKVTAPIIQTVRGPEKLVKQVCIEKRVQRTSKGEFISRNARAREVDRTGETTQVEYTSQKIDPTHATESLGVNEIVSVTSCISETTGGTQRHRNVKKKTIKCDKLLGKVNMNPAHINRLIKEEAEDVENTLKMAPPNLISTSAEKFPMKRKLQNLRMNSESMALVQKSVVHPVPAADEVEAEASPEVLASILNAVERGATPESAPQQIFNTLFPTTEDQRIHVSSAATGPLRDVVVPTQTTKIITDEAIDEEMEKALLTMTQGEQEQLTDGVCDKVESPKPPEISFKGEPIELSTEIPPWADEDINNISLLLGAVPISSIEPLDASTMESKDVSAEMSHGVDYFLDADTVPFENKVQLRGSRLPKWFPGYMAAFPHLPEVVKISRSPSGVLHTAWKAVQPKIFPDDTVLIM